MSPSFSFNRVLDCRRVNAKHISELPETDIFGRIEEPNLFHFIIRQLGGCAFLSSQGRVSVSSLEHHVLSVLSLCVHEKMIRIYACRIVAMMKHAQAVWNWTNVKLPRNSVSKRINLIPRDDSIAERTLRCHPRPAVIFSVFFYFLPKTIRKISSTVFGTKNVTLVATSRNLEFSTTDRAYFSRHNDVKGIVLLMRRASGDNRRSLRLFQTFLNFSSLSYA